MARQKQPKAVHQLTAAQFDALFKTEDDCIKYLIVRRWPTGVVCPRCGNPSVYQLHARAWHWQCTQCAPGGNTGYRFSHLTGTIFENTNKPLKDWFRVAHLMLVSKKGMSALQIYRYMGFGSYKTAWLMCHKIRVAMTEDISQLGGIVEVDETFVGGKAENRHKDKRGGTGGGHASGGKAIVAGAVRRKGNVVARVIENVQSATLTAFVREAVSHKVSLLCTDAWPAYRSPHESPHFRGLENA
jgi:transposase-like protein